MKKNALASLALVFATAFALADNLGTPTKVGSLSRSSDYVYEADEVDALLGGYVVTNRTVNGHSLTGNVTVGESDITVSPSGGNTTLGSWVDSVDAMMSSLPSTSNPILSICDDGNVGSGGNSTKIGDLKINGTNVIAAIQSLQASAYVHPSYTARTGKPTADASPSFGGTFTVSQITSDSSGHVTGATDRTITLPTLPTASTSAAGIVQLSSSTNGTSTAKAATESAVKDAIAAAKAYADTKAAAGVTKNAVAAALTAQGITSADNLDDMDALAAQIAKIVAVLEALD